MKVIIAGPRDIPLEIGIVLVKEAVEESGWKFEITEVVEGGAAGIDNAAHHWGEENNIRVNPFNANWYAYGKSAGPIRNLEMAKYADALIAVRNSVAPTKGTANMIKTANKIGIKVFVYDFDLKDYQ